MVKAKVNDSKITLLNYSILTLINYRSMQKAPTSNGHPLLGRIVEVFHVCVCVCVRVRARVRVCE